MTNRIRGKFDFDVDGKAYALHFTANGMCALEDAADMSSAAFLKRMEAAGQDGDLSLRDVRLLVWAGLQEHQEGLSLADAGRIIEGVGGVAAAMELTGKAVAAAMGGGDAKASDDVAAGKTVGAAA